MSILEKSLIFFNLISVIGLIWRVFADGLNLKFQNSILSDRADSERIKKLLEDHKTVINELVMKNAELTKELENAKVDHN